MKSVWLKHIYFFFVIGAQHYGTRNCEIFRIEFKIEMLNTGYVKEYHGYRGLRAHSPLFTQQQQAFVTHI